MKKTKSKKNNATVRLDPYEKEIEDALPEDVDLLRSSKNINEELSFAKAAAASYLRKDAKINIRLSHYDLEGLRRLAAREGLPYQTLISSILHKYISQHL